MSHLYSVHRALSSSHDVGILILRVNHHDVTLFQYSYDFQSSMSSNFFTTKTLIFMLSNVIDCILLHQAVTEKKKKKKTDIKNLSNLAQTGLIKSLLFKKFF